MNTKTGRIVIALLGVSSVMALYSFARPKAPVEADSSYRLVMGTFAHIIAVAPDRRTADKSIDAALRQLQNIETLMSYHRADSELAGVNRSAHKQPVKVSKETFEVLQKAIEFSRLSDGAFDVTVGPLVDLWRRAAEANSAPTDSELADTRSKIGYQNLILDANEMTVRFAVEGMKLDLGAIAKGYGIDKAVEAMKTCGAVGGLVDVGGDIRCFGKPSKGKTHWLIGLQDPNDKIENRKSKIENSIGMGAPLLVLKLTDAAVATSGHYRRFAVIGGKKQSHIIDTKTGYSSDKLASVTIIAKDATAADALATAVSVMGAEKGLALIEKLPETEAILIPAQPNSGLIKTPGAEKYIK
jgi:thiamine biosynthesis lipoprotein